MSTIPKTFHQLESRKCIPLYRTFVTAFSSSRQRCCGPRDHKVEIYFTSQGLIVVRVSTFTNSIRVSSASHFSIHLQFHGPLTCFT